MPTPAPRTGIAWSDNGPDCPRCSGTVYRYQIHEADGQPETLVDTYCMGCHESRPGAFRVPSMVADVRLVSRQHRAVPR